MKIEDRLNFLEKHIHGLITQENLPHWLSNLKEGFDKLKKEVNNQRNYFELKYGKLHTILKDIVNVIDRYTEQPSHTVGFDFNYKSRAIRELKEKLGE